MCSVEKEALEFSLLQVRQHITPKKTVLTPRSTILPEMLIGPSASLEIPHIVWNLKAHCCIHKNPPLVTILSQMNAVHTIQSYFCNIHFNIILQFTLVLKVVSFLQVPPSKPCAFFFSLMCATQCTHLILLDLISQIIRSCTVMNTHQHSALCNFLHALVTSSLL